MRWAAPVLLVILIGMPVLSEEVPGQHRHPGVREAPSNLPKRQLWRRLSSEERRLLRRRYERWRRLPPHIRAKILENARRFQQLPPEKKELLRMRAERWKRLSPVERAKILERYRYWKSLPEKKRMKVRALLRHLRSIPPEEVQRLKSLPSPERKRLIERLLKNPYQDAT